MEQCIFLLLAICGGMITLGEANKEVLGAETTFGDSKSKGKSLRRTSTIHSSYFYGDIYTESAHILKYERVV
jgi:hypothetical protein